MVTLAATQHSSAGGRSLEFQSYQPLYQYDLDIPLRLESDPRAQFRQRGAQHRRARRLRKLVLFSFQRSTTYKEQRK